MDEQLVSYRAQRSLESDSQLVLDDATKMVGCYKALAKIGMDEASKISREPMRQALAFCQNIKLSQMFASEFGNVIEEYTANEEVAEEFKTDLEVQLHHVDGTFNAEQRNEKLSWLREDDEKNICRVLTNVRCLSEGVDVPALDAIMFLHPRKSQIDVVQSVGRVMRKAEGKDLGYVIIPIAVAPGISPEKALNDNEKYKVVWQILNALRAHDERLDRDINKLSLGEDVSDRIEIISGVAGDELEATTSVVDDIKPKAKVKEEAEDEQGLGDETEEEGETEEPEQLSFLLSDLSQAIKAKIVEKCGTRDYWENWANDIAKIAKAHIDRINGILVNTGTPEREAFDAFLAEIRDDLNPEISESDAVEMLAQHIITRPVFDSLFLGNRFTTENAVSKAMETVLSRLYDRHIDTEAHTLERFYESVKLRAEGIVTATGRQTLIKDLYDRFFRNAFPGMTQRLGIVYTPTEVVDFIIHSVEDVLRDEFDASLGDEGIHILDPFTGTGTFVARLMQSGLIPKERLPYKYKNEIHANEMVLLAYYVACINIEAVYDDLVKENQYQPFNGMVLTDTFQLYEQERDMIADLLPDNSQRRTAQKERNIRVIVGNPPYSAGQKSANDNLANITYSNLDRRIEETYVINSSAKNNRHLYDSYIRSFRWASDRVGHEGVIGFVSGAGWIDRNFADGMRKSICGEFSKVYVFHLRGDIRKNILSKSAAGEGENIFGQGSMTGVAITILVKSKGNVNSEILFYDIGKDLKHAQKLTIIRGLKSINGISEKRLWALINPDKSGDWINQGDKMFSSYIALGDKSNNSPNTIFKNYTLGATTNRDAWCYNFSYNKLKENIQKTIKFYSDEINRYNAQEGSVDINNFICRDTSKINWSRSLIKKLSKREEIIFDDNNIYTCNFRPFTKSNLYFSRQLNEYTYQLPSVFPNKETKNIVIAVSGVGARSGISAFMFDAIADLQSIDNGQCFPLKIYEKQEDEKGLFANQRTSNNHVGKDGITDEGLTQFENAYPGATFTKEDLFYYVYGLLHSPEYRERFQNNLSKELPRIPAVKCFDDFSAFSEAGRTLGHLHINYGSIDPHSVTFKEGDLQLANIPDPESFFRVEKMKFPNKGDKSSVIYNKNITIQNIPLEAYEYVVNGKPALEWVMDRQCVKTDKESGIVNDANDYANETMNNPAYPLELFQRVITVSLETMKIVRGLPELDID